MLKREVDRLKWIDVLCETQLEITKCLKRIEKLEEVAGGINTKIKVKKVRTRLEKLDDILEKYEKGEVSEYKFRGIALKILKQLRGYNAI